MDVWGVAVTLPPSDTPTSPLTVSLLLVTVVFGRARTPKLAALPRPAKPDGCVRSSRRSMAGRKEWRARAARRAGRWNQNISEPPGWGVRSRPGGNPYWRWPRLAQAED